MGKQPTPASPPTTAEHGQVRALGYSPNNSRTIGTTFEP
jgi:hypothetical protein